jgi:ATP-dependent helicase HrpB
MAIYEKPKPGADGAKEAILEGIRIKGVENLPCWTGASLQMKSRMDFLHNRMTDGLVWPEVTDELLLGALEGFVDGAVRWKDLEKIDMTGVLDLILAESGHDRRELDRLAPVKMEVPSGSNMSIRYEGDEPTVQVRLQECFGLMQTPKVAGGTVPIVMTLLSPAQRPIQVTKDLAGFWKGAYQLVRKEMRGRYPKHYWPEDPFTAVATRRVRPGGA